MNITSRVGFNAEVRRLVVSCGLPVIESIYRVLEESDEVEAGRHVYACEKGCARCCYQMVTATALEFEAVKRFYNSLSPGSQATVRRAASAPSRDWMRYFTTYRTQIETANPMEIHRNWRGHRCPFLAEAEGECLIHQARPIDCRTFHSRKKCDRRGLLAERLTGPCERWANDLILETQKKVSGNMAVIPLPHLAYLFFEQSPPRARKMFGRR